MPQPNGITEDERSTTIEMLNNILRQPEFLHHRAKQYEEICYRRSASKQHYYALVSEGIRKINKTYAKRHTKAAAEPKAPDRAAAGQSEQLNPDGSSSGQHQRMAPNTPVATSQPPPPAPSQFPSAASMPQPSVSTAINDFLRSLGVTPCSTQPAIITNPASNLPNPSSTLPNPSAGFPTDVTGAPIYTTYGAPTSAAYRHLSAAEASQVPVVSRATSTSTLARNPPPIHCPGNQSTPAKGSVSPLGNNSRKAPKTPRAKSSTERPRTIRSKKRNSAKAGLKTPPHKPPTARRESPKLRVNTEQATQENVSSALPPTGPMQRASSPFQQTQIGSIHCQVSASPHSNLQPQPVPQSDLLHPSNAKDPSLDDRIFISDEIHVSIAQVYIAAASIGFRLSVDAIKCLSREQVLRLFLDARQVALSNVGTFAPIDNAGHANTSTQQIDPCRISFQNSNQTSGDQAGLHLPHEASLQSAAQQQQHGHAEFSQMNAHGLPMTAIPTHSNVANGMVMANTNISDQPVRSQRTQFFDVPQGFPNQQIPQHGFSNGSHQVQGVEAQTTPAEGVHTCTDIPHINPSAAFQTNATIGSSDGMSSQVAEANSGPQSGNSRHAPSDGLDGIKATGTPQKPAQQTPLNSTQRHGIDATPQTSAAPSSSDVLTLRLQRFQQKYRVYLKLVQENLAAMMGKGNKRDRYMRYMHYSIRLLTCSMSSASMLSMELIDRVESFLREYLVRYQGIASKKAKTTAPGIGVPNSSDVPNGSSHASNVPILLPSGSSHVGVSTSKSHPNEASNPEMSHAMPPANVTPSATFPSSNAPEVSSTLRTSSSQTLLKKNQIAQGETTNAGIQANEAQREAIAAAKLRHTQAASSTQIQNDRFQAENVLQPASAPNLRQEQVQPAAEVPQVAPGVEGKTPEEIYAMIAKRVSRVNHFVRLAVHSTDLYEKKLGQESLLRFKEERIAEVNYVLQCEKMNAAAAKRDAGTEQPAEPSLMDIIQKECEDAHKKHTKLMIEINEEWNRPVVSCLLGFESIRLPKMIVHVPGTYKKERSVTFGFERPPLGWIGAVDEVRQKFYSLHEGKEGVREILEAWMVAAEEVLKED